MNNILRFTMILVAAVQVACSRDVASQEFATNTDSPPVCYSVVTVDPVWSRQNGRFLIAQYQRMYVDWASQVGGENPPILKDNTILSATGCGDEPVFVDFGSIPVSMVTVSPVSRSFYLGELEAFGSGEICLDVNGECSEQDER